MAVAGSNDIGWHWMDNTSKCGSGEHGRAGVSYCGVKQASAVGAGVRLG
jgi:hypothetical protein